MFGLESVKILALNFVLVIAASGMVPVLIGFILVAFFNVALAIVRILFVIHVATICLASYIFEQSTPKISKPASLFSILPTELRLKIFKQCDLLWDNKTMPALIKALRSDRKSHKDAMAVFSAKNTFTLRSKNYWGFRWMAKETISRIQKLNIVLQ